MKTLLQCLVCLTLLLPSTADGQSTTSLACDPPFLVSGLYDPTLPNDPDPAIFSAEVKNEIMADGFQGKDKEYGDYDSDGDIDILYTKNDNQLWILPNTGTATSPEYIFDNQFFTGLIGIYSFRIMDWLADGIPDLLVLEQFPGDPANVSLYLNIESQIGFPAPIGIVIEGSMEPLSSGQFIEVGDIDGDGFPEILVSGQETLNGTGLYKNLGTGWAFPPTYQLIAPQTFAAPMIPGNGGSAPCPELFDADCDGDLDLFISDPLSIAGANGHVDYYENTGAGSPFLYFTKGSPNPYGLDDVLFPDTDLSCDWIITRFADFFGDGRAEGIAHNACSSNFPNGDIFYYKNSYSCEASFTFSGPEFCQTLHFTSSFAASVPVTWSWDFGDPGSGINNTSSLEHPSHTFTACGPYNVCLMISGSGCADTFCQIIIVIDPSPPVALCSNGIGIVMDANCIATANLTLLDEGSFDNCLLTSVTLSQDTFTQCGLFPVTLTATDWCGNTATCVSGVQVYEDVPPVIRCPSNMILTATSPACTMVVNGLKWVLLTDNCSTPTVSYTVTGASNYSGTGDASGLLFHQGVSTINYVATDACGNMDSCSFEVKLNCICDCPNNLILNPGFDEGTVAGDMPQQGHTNGWHKASESPQIIPYDSCCDAYAIQMWGKLTGGESILQDGVTYLAGHHYKISFAAKYFQGSNSLATNVQFGFTAANAQFYNNPYTCTNCEHIGSSPPLTNTGWKTITLPIWTPTQNWDELIIRAFNSLGYQAWGRIDNICIREVPNTCCTDPDGFTDNIRNAVHITVDERTEEVVFSIGNLPECDSIAYIDWGDGNVTPGPFGGNEERRNRFLDHLLARVEYQANEYNQEEATHPICLQTIQSDSVEAFLASTKYLVRQKKCGKSGEQQKKIEWTTRVACQDQGGRSEVTSSRYHIEMAVLKPFVFPDPIIRLKDELGLPILTEAREEIMFFPNDLVTAKIESISPAPEGYGWYGLQSNLLTPTSADGLDSLILPISFSWLDLPAGSADSTGAVWISDDKDDVYGEYILDGYADFDTAVTTHSTIYGLRPKVVCKLTHSFGEPQSWTLYWKWCDVWWDFGGRGTEVTPYHLQTAILKATILPEPEIELTDTLYHPLVNQAGEEVILNYNAGVTAKIQRLYPAPSGYEWYGLQSNPLSPTTSSAADSLFYLLKFSWLNYPMGGEDSTGAFWISDDKDDLYGEFITDGFSLLGKAVLDTTTSIFPPAQNGMLQVYPNPTTGALTLELPVSATSDMRLRVVSVMGQNILEKKAEPGKKVQTLPTDQIHEGLYIIQWLVDDHILSFNTFVKQRSK